MGYGTATVQAPAGLLLGDEWWQQVASYGLGRYIDAETLQPYQVQDVSRQLGIGQDGGMYPRGVPANGAAALLSNPLVLVAGLALIGGGLYLALK